MKSDKKSLIYIGLAIPIIFMLYTVLTPFWGMNGIANLYLQLFAREKPAEPVMICIDDASLQRYGPWPWPRRVLSELVDEVGIAKPKAIGLDILFVEASPDDQRLAQSLHTAGKVCLADYLKLHTKSTWGKRRITQGMIEEPIPILKKAASSSGFIDVFSTRDDTVKMMRLRLKGRDSFVSSIAKTAYPSFKIRQDELLLKVAANPKDFTTFSALRVLNGQAKKELRGRVVLIGVTATGISDRYLTSATSLGRIPGIYLHAYALANLLQWGSLTPIPVSIVLFFIMCIVAFLVLQPFIRGLRASLIIIPVIWATSVILYGHGYWISPLYPTVAILFAVYAKWFRFTLVLQAEKSRTREYLGKYLSPIALDQITASYEHQPTITRELTVLIVDLRGYTGFAESTLPDQVVTILNQYLGGIADIIINHHGMIDKFTGDGILAFFLSDTTKMQARLGIKAAFEIQRSYQFGDHPGIGIAIATGPVSFGRIGSNQRHDFTIIGDTVNIAARLEKLAKQGSIIIDEQTAHAAGIVGNYRSVKLKGRRSSVKTLHLTQDDEEIYSKLKGVEENG